MIRKAPIILLATLAIGTFLAWWAFRDTGLRKKTYTLSDGDISFAANRGGFYVNWHTYYDHSNPPGEHWLIDLPEDRFPWLWTRLLVRFRPGSRYVFFYCPVRNALGFFVLFAAYPTIALMRRPLRRRRRRKRGLCLTCGYNLTGNTSGMCPECTAKVEG